MAEFPRIQKQGNAIACAYKAIGLYSIPLLTIVTTVSLSNVFTAGAFGRVAGIETVWAIIFSAAIEVNSVRLFIESAVNDDRSAFIIGIILSIVAGTALLIEGLQQSIGLDWNSQDIHFIIALLVGFRVFCVVVLLAREGRKLGHALKENTTPAKSEETPATSEEAPSSEQETPTVTIPLLDVGVKRDKVRSVLKEKPDASISEIEELAQVSRGYASKIRAEVLAEIQSEPHRLNGVH